MSKSEVENNEALKGEQILIFFDKEKEPTKQEDFIFDLMDSLPTDNIVDYYI